MTSLLLAGAAALCAPAPAAAADPPARVSIAVRGAIPDGAKTTVRMTVRDGGRTVYRGRIGIERRGQSSQRFPKRAWSIELRDRKGDDREVALLGMPADADWVLYAGYNDKTLMRNVLAYETSHRLGRYASRTRFVEVTLNGRYHGVYVLMERLELGKHRLDLPGPARLLEWTFSYQALRKGRSFRLPVSDYFLLFEDPEREDLGRRRRSQVRGSVGAAERALYRGGFRDPTTGWRRHIDEGAAVDFLLLNELFKNEDAFHASTYLAQGAGRTWQLGPVWDFDISMGNSDYGPSRLLTGSMLEDRAWAGRLYRDPALVAALAARWRALRADGLRPGAPARGRPPRPAPHAHGGGGAQLPPLARPGHARLAQPARGRVAHDLRERGARAALVARAPDRLDGPARGRARARVLIAPGLGGRAYPCV